MNKRVISFLILSIMFSFLIPSKAFAWGDSTDIKNAPYVPPQRDPSSDSTDSTSSPAAFNTTTARYERQEQARLKQLDHDYNRMLSGQYLK